MKAQQIYFALNLILQYSVVLSVFIPSNLYTFTQLKPLRTLLQHPIMNIPNIALPPFTNDNKGSSSKGGNEQSRDDQVIISDVIGKQRAINVFASFTRDIESISRRLEDNAQNTTVLAPLNSQVEKLPRKPWEDPRDYETLGASAYEGEQGEDRAQRNLRRFVEAHILPVSPWKEGEKVGSLDGGEVWWEEKAGQKLVQPGNIEVQSVAERVANGEVWILKGVLNYQ